MSEDWINVAKINDIPPGNWCTVEIDDISVLVFNLNNEFFAIENVCTHDGGELATGWLEGDEIVCPRHGAHFCVRTGAATQPPAYEDTATFPTRILGDYVQVRDARWD